MDYSKLNWSGDFLWSEIIGKPYELDEEEEFIVGVYTLKDFPEINVYVNTDEEKIIEAWVDVED